MLELDQTTKNPQLGEVIAMYCAAFGTVKSVKIHDHPKRFALIEMSTHHEALNLAAMYGRTAFGTSVLIYLH